MDSISKNITSGPSFSKDDFLMMLVELNQWRATIGCFRVSIKTLSPMSRIVQPFSVLSRVLELYWFCYCSIAISIIVLPFVIIVQSLAMHTTITTQLYCLPLFARMHRLTKIVVYSTIELDKRIPHAIWSCLL